MDASGLSVAIQRLRPDDAAEFVRTMRHLGKLLIDGVDGDQGHRLRDELLGARIYEAVVIHSENQSIEGWRTREELLDAWVGRDAELIRVEDGMAYFGTMFSGDDDADEGYKNYILRDKEAGPLYFSFTDVLEVTVNPDGKRFIILG